MILRSALVLLALAAAGGAAPARRLREARAELLRVLTPRVATLQALAAARRR